MSNHLVHIADRVLNRPLMIHPDKLALIATVLEGRINIDASDFKALDIDAHLIAGPGATRFVGDAEFIDPNNPRSQIKYRVSKGVAIIPVLGSLVNRGAWLGASSGMTSYEGIAFQLADAVANPKVKSILLDIDSPGGEAVGAFELADKIRAWAKVKSITAVVNGMAASAAYAIASACTAIIGTPSGVSGSIGVVLMHADYSGQLQQKGVRPTLIHAGAHKVDGHPYGPLPDSVRADLQAEVNQFYELFVSGVAKGRKGRMTEKAIRGTEARTFIGQAALDAGLVDAVGSFETVLADLTKGGTVRNSNPKGLSMDKTYTQAEFDAAITAARTEAVNQTTTALKAEFDKATGAAAETGRKEGATAERERIKGILACDEAKGRSALALHVATSTDMSADAAKGMLAAAPKESAATADAGATSHGLFLSEGQTKPSSSGEKGDHGWGDIVANLNKGVAR